MSIVRQARLGGCWGGGAQNPGQPRPHTPSSPSGARGPLRAIFNISELSCPLTTSLTFASLGRPSSCIFNASCHLCAASLPTGHQHPHRSQASGSVDTMVYCGKPSKGCQMCRMRRIKVRERRDGFLVPFMGPPTSWESPPPPRPVMLTSAPFAGEQCDETKPSCNQW